MGFVIVVFPQTIADCMRQSSEQTLPHVLFSPSNGCMMCAQVDELAEAVIKDMKIEECGTGGTSSRSSNSKPDNSNGHTVPSGAIKSIDQPKPAKPR